jgi:hypothetical protein
MMSVFVVRAFVKMREALISRSELERRSRHGLAISEAGCSVLHAPCSLLITGFCSGTLWQGVKEEIGKGKCLG